MTETFERTRLNGQHGKLPPRLVAIMRAELPSLADEIITEIRDRVPEYARPMEGPFGTALRAGVEQALTLFVDMFAGPSTSRAQLDEVCRGLGRREAELGRSLDSLQAAYRIGAHVAWHRVMAVGQDAHLSSPVMSMLADAIFGYINEMAALSSDGYQEANIQSAGARRRLRRRLLRLILSQPAADHRAITHLAEQAGWPVPEQVTPVAVQAVSPDLEALADDDLLTDLDRTRPRLLVPGSPGASRWAALEKALGGHRAALGLTVPLAGAADSLRWAEQALTLADAGIIDDGQMMACEDHLVTLWLLSDSALADQVTRRQLGALAGLTDKQRHRLTETFGAWLETRGTAAEIADRLQVHPQTVRYRIRQLERALGDQFADPDARFAMEMALRVIRLRERATRTSELAP
jgi:DNA-binding CsgD family transcriptional regulator